MVGVGVGRGKSVLVMEFMFIACINMEIKPRVPFVMKFMRSVLYRLREISNRRLRSDN